MIRYLVFISLMILLGSCVKDDPANQTSVCRQAPEIYVLESTPGGAWVEFVVETGAGTWSVAPSFAIWADYGSNRRQTLYVTCKAARNAWETSNDTNESLPVWFSVRDQQGLTPESPELDAVTTATPTRSVFTMHWQPENITQGDTVQLFIEANLPNDHNDFYTPSSGSNGQPSLIWTTRFVMDSDNSLRVIDNPRYAGHSHPRGQTSNIYSDRNGITTALEIFKNIRVQQLGD